MNELTQRVDPGVALVKEARRRRRLFVGATLLVMAGATSSGIVASGGGGGRHHSSIGERPGPAARPNLPPATGKQKSPKVALPSSALFNQISVTPSGLLLTAETPATAGKIDPTCVAEPVDPRTLAVGTTAQAGCRDPLLFGETVEAVKTPIPGSNNANLSIAYRDPATGQVTDGPVVMNCGSFSDTRPVTAAGGRWLWDYDVETTGPELLQVSTQSGAVVEVIPMPEYYRPLLAADDGGVWVGNSLEGSAAPALLYVAAASRVPATAISGTSTPVCWLAAAGTKAWRALAPPKVAALRRRSRSTSTGSPRRSSPGPTPPWRSPWSVTSPMACGPFRGRRQ